MQKCNTNTNLIFPIYSFQSYKKEKKGKLLTLNAINERNTID